MPLFSWDRVPELELMDEAAEVDAYTSAAAQSYLESVDVSFLTHLSRLMDEDRLRTARVLDLGSGPGQILIMMKNRWPGMTLLGVDAGQVMVEQARAQAAEAGVEIEFRRARLGPEGESSLDFLDGDFDLVTCNSVLHHLEDPLGALNEIARLARKDGAVLLRDLQRPKFLLPYALHVRAFGRHYAGEMRRLYEASVAAAYTPRELARILAQSQLNDGRSRVFSRGLTHAGMERAAS